MLGKKDFGNKLSNNSHIQKTLTTKDYRRLREDAEIVSNDPFGDKVFLLPYGNYLKLFRVKRFLSSARLWPYSKRFAYNAKRLNARDIIVPKIIEIYQIPSIGRSAVIYRSLQGRTLREVRSAIDAKTIRCLGSLYRGPHQNHVNNRSLHLGNIIQLGNQKLGLIDTADLSAYECSLPKRLRLRNYRHLRRYETDRRVVAEYRDDFVPGLSSTDSAYVRKLSNAKAINCIPES